MSRRALNANGMYDQQLSINDIAARLLGDKLVMNGPLFRALGFLATNGDAKIDESTIVVTGPIRCSALVSRDVLVGC